MADGAQRCTHRQHERQATGQKKGLRELDHVRPKFEKFDILLN